MTRKKITTIEQLGDAVQDVATALGAHIRDSAKQHHAIHHDIKLIHEDLKAHDQRAEEVNETIRELLDLKKLEGRPEQMRTNIREKLGVEV